MPNSPQGVSPIAAEIRGKRETAMHMQRSNVDVTVIRRVVLIVKCQWQLRHEQLKLMWAVSTHAAVCLQRCAWSAVLGDHATYDDGGL
jgi:hypothetical protein